MSDENSTDPLEGTANAVVADLHRKFWYTQERAHASPPQPDRPDTRNAWCTRGDPGGAKPRPAEARQVELRCQKHRGRGGTLPRWPQQRARVPPGVVEVPRPPRKGTPV